MSDTAETPAEYEGAQTRDPSSGESTAPSEPSYRVFNCRPDAGTDALRTAAEAAGKAIEGGELVVLPTDTVYGVGADAFSSEAVQRLLDAKGRGRDIPPPVLIADTGLIKALAAELPMQATDLVAAHWPGPLTVICHAQPSLRMDLGDTEGTIALRTPDHPVTRQLLRRTGPMAVSSANRTGQSPALTADEAVSQLGDSVSVYLDGGHTAGNLPSTIVDFTQSDSGVIVRVGALSLEVLRQTVPGLVGLAEPEPVSETAAEITAQIEDAGDEQPSTAAVTGLDKLDRRGEGVLEGRDPAEPRQRDSH